MTEDEKKKLKDEQLFEKYMSGEECPDAFIWPELCRVLSQELSIRLRCICISMTQIAEPDRTKLFREKVHPNLMLLHQFVSQVHLIQCDPKTVDLTRPPPQPEDMETSDGGRIILTGKGGRA